MKSENVLCQVTIQYFKASIKQKYFKASSSLKHLTVLNLPSQIFGLLDKFQGTIATSADIIQLQIPTFAWFLNRKT